MVSKLSEIKSGVFIPDPDPGFWVLTDPDFLPIPYPGSRGQKGTGSPIPDPQHFSKASIFSLWWLQYFHFDADPGQDFYIDADPDQAFHFDADPDPDPASQNDADPDL